MTIELVAADYGTGPSDSSSLYWKKLAGEFESDHPGVTVEVDVRPWTTVDGDVAHMVKEGNAPDIAQVGSYADYAERGDLYRADEVLNVPVQSNFLPQLADAGKVDQVQYGMPFVASTRLLFYNRSLFDAAGLPAPRTWADIASDARALKARGVPVPFALPLGTEEAQAESMMWMLSGGGGYTGPGTDAYAIDSDDNVRTFTWLRDNLVAKGLTGHVDPARYERAAAFKDFTAGRVGMLNGHPTLMREAEKAHVAFGTVPLPGPEGASKYSMGVADWMMAFKQRGHAKEIGEFLDFAYNDKNVMDFVGRYDLLPVTWSANHAMASDRRYQDLGRFQKALDTSELYPFDKSSWSRVSESVKAHIGQAVEPGQDPAKVLMGISADAKAAEPRE